MKYTLRKTDPMSIFDSFFGGIEGSPSVVTPAADVYADEQSYHIDMDLPGFTKEEVGIEVKDNLLIIKAEHHSDQEEKDNDKLDYYRRERVSTSYSRSFQLSDTLDVDNITAGFNDGVLKLSIPKKEKALPRQIAIS